MAPVGPRIGAQLLGYNITAVAPGKRAFPLHNHHVNEEMFFILSGSGELRVGDERFTLRRAISSPIRRAVRRPRTRSSTPEPRSCATWP